MVMSRYLETQLQSHFDEFRQMIFLSGPRQVGKTTLAQKTLERFPQSRYLSWDIYEHRIEALQNPKLLTDALRLNSIEASHTICAIDEFHKHAKWRDFLKSTYDAHENLNLLITGSGMLREFSRGGDSLRGRYFPYTLHPISVAELTQSEPAADSLVHASPREISQEQWEALRRFGGFPDPFLKANVRFHNQWCATWHDQLLHDEIRDLTRIHEISQIESLAVLLRNRVGNLTSFSSLARGIMSSVDSIRRWLTVLESLCFCFVVRPWYENLTRALRKEPKIYLWDWSQVRDEGARYENLVASALFKATQYWTETGLGQFGLHFVRDKEKREVDFVVVRDNKPWILVEAKTSNRAKLSSNLAYFQQRLHVPHAVQVAMNADFYDGDCVHVERPTIVPAKSFLSQLV